MFLLLFLFSLLESNYYDILYTRVIYSLCLCMSYVGWFWLKTLYRFVRGKLEEYCIPVRHRKESTRESMAISSQRYSKSHRNGTRGTQPRGRGIQANCEGFWQEHTVNVESEHIFTTETCLYLSLIRCSSVVNTIYIIYKWMHTITIGNTYTTMSL